MKKYLEELAPMEKTALIIALQKELINYKELLKKDSEQWFYKAKVKAIYNLFDKMGYRKELVDRSIGS